MSTQTPEISGFHTPISHMPMEMAPMAPMAPMVNSPAVTTTRTIPQPPPQTISYPTLEDSRGEKSKWSK
eukprot:gnl/Chilomastix_caulleri/6991.p1 GENE.gnl/Chilomastix_caulleri/6991~~gnl/Chilomastix_caulleri/6991.p1  ORF type:complete len:69 (+),score=8.37 gnl/Chilomastix_caulleri/6991:193-399(+)